MEIIIHQAILHVLDTTMDAPVLSGSGMEMTAEKTAYFQYHIEKLLASDDIRQCRPLPDSAFKNELEHNHDFVDLSCRQDDRTCFPICHTYPLFYHSNLLLKA